jgi:hypothetical protein
MGKLLFVLAAAIALATAADDPWSKVQAIKSGTEVRIVRKGVTKPIEAKFDEARETSLVVVVKNEQVAIPRDEVERLEARTEKPRVTTDTKTGTTNPDERPPMGMNHGANVPSQTYSSGVSLGKPEYQVVYRKPLGAPKK